MGEFHGVEQGMNSGIRIFEISPAWLAVLAGGVLLLWAFSLLVVRRSLRSRREAGYDDAAASRDWSIPEVDAGSGLRSPFHSWDPRVKIVSLLFFMFCAASLTGVASAALALAVSLAALFGSGLPRGRAFKRVGAMTGFLGMFLLVMPLTVPGRPGDLVAVFRSVPFLSFNLRGLELAGLICVKACAVVILVEPLLGTSPFAVTVRAMERLRVPSAICQMLLLCHRYTYVFAEEMKRMQKGMKARGFKARSDLRTLKAVGNFVGMLLVHSFERTQRVYEAMTSRGFTGVFPRTTTFQAEGRDFAKGALWLVVGTALVLLDRIFSSSLAFWH